MRTRTVALHCDNLRAVKRAIVLLALALFTASAFAAAKTDAVFYPEKLRAIDAAIDKSIDEGKLPGGVLWLERHGTAYHRAYGNRALVPEKEAMTENTIFDAASLTKVTATTPSIWLLIERGKVNLDDPVSRTIPEFKGGWRDEITIRHLLSHTSGLRPDLDLDKPWSGYDTGIKLATGEMPRNRPGFIFKYSDINFELLGEVVRRVSGKPLNEFAEREVFKPLKMKDTRFRPCVPQPEKPAAATDAAPDASPATRPAGSPAPRGPMPIGACKSTLPLSSRIAPTEALPDGTMLRGVVHDPTARRMGGVAGHAGLFTTAHDLARYARMLLNNGSLDGVRLFKPQTIAMMTDVVSPPDVAVRRGGGWDIDSGYSRPRGDLFPIGSFGHTGFTGGMLWIDPFSNTFYLFLSNRVHPNGKGSVTALQRTLGTLAAESVKAFDFVALWKESARSPGSQPGAKDDRLRSGAPSSGAPSLGAPSLGGPSSGAPSTSRAPLSRRRGGQVNFITGGSDVMNGIDVLNATAYKPLQNLRIGLITNHTGIDRSGNPTVDLLRSAPGVQVVALFSPEHGIRGELDEKVGDTTDPVSGLPIHSLYGDRRKPSPEQLANIDALVFDIQDVGARFYTYISTLALAVEAAGENHKKIFVLDRVNPIGGISFEGPLAKGDSTFVAFHSILVQHGMTVGELARMFNAERNSGADLEVIGLRGWARYEWQDEAGLPWINTSPNMRSLTAAGLYPGIGLLESAISVGRGTPTPFEVAGAPYIDEQALARELTALQLPGIDFQPVRFTPDASIFKGESCGGLRFVVTDRRALRPVRTGLALAVTLQRMYGERYALDKIEHLLRDPGMLEAIRAGKSLEFVTALYRVDEESFKERRAKYLLY
jgi:uncharacterized protein YbbC (DUF1343 family)/CubicO group peptidase (beta-lactamase class C family)